jgi:hypothetical protein
MVTAVDSRSQLTNRREALGKLIARLEDMRSKELSLQAGALKASLVDFDRSGGGTRAATWCEWRDEVNFHLAGRKTSMKKALAGQFW